MKKVFVSCFIAIFLSAMAVVIPGALSSASAEPNGCGAESGLSRYLVPNGISGIYDFTSACNNHDDCYGTAGSSKSACDLQFAIELRDSCDGAICSFFAELYAWAVEVFGGGAFNAAQEAAWNANHEFAVSELMRAISEDPPPPPEAPVPDSPPAADTPPADTNPAGDNAPANDSPPVNDGSELPSDGSGAPDGGGYDAGPSDGGGYDSGGGGGYDSGGGGSYDGGGGGGGGGYDDNYSTVSLN